MKLSLDMVSRHVFLYLCLPDYVVKLPPPNGVQDHSKRLIPCRSLGADPLECLRRLLLSPKTMTLPMPLSPCHKIMINPLIRMLHCLFVLKPFQSFPS